MKIAIAIAVFIGSSAFGAPTNDWLRTKKSASYGGAQSYGGAHSYGGAQSYGGASSYGAATSYGPPCSGAPLAPIALYLAPQRETSEHARTYEAPGYGASASILAPSPSSAVGYFPNAKIGGCSVPLLLSCAPNVVAGHLAHAHSYSAPSYSAPSYKQNENQEETTELRETMEKSWSDAERASHAGHHHHLISVKENPEALAAHPQEVPV